MKKLSLALKELARENDLIRMGLSHRLLNLSQLARFVRPLINARVGKDVTESAILMNLSRMQKEFSSSEEGSLQSFGIENIVINSNLCVVTYTRTPELHRHVNLLYNRAQQKNSFMTITEGISEVTLILSREVFATFGSDFEEQQIYINDKVASVGVRFKIDYQDVPGFFFMIFQQFYFQNINIVEIASTSTELIVYLEEDDVRLAVDTIFNRFGRTNA